MDDKELVADMRETVRYWEHIYPRDTWGAYQRAHEQAADRIEALTAKAEALEEVLRKLRDCDWVISLPDRMDAVRDIARDALTAWGE